MKVIYTTSDFVQADLIQAMLRGNKIESLLQNEGANTWGVGAALLEIMVREEDFQRAELLIRENPVPAADETRSEGGALERRVAAFRRRRVWIWLAMFLVPSAIILTTVGLTGDRESAVPRGLLLLAVVVVGLGSGFVIHRTLRRAPPGSSRF